MAKENGHKPGKRSPTALMRERIAARRLQTEDGGAKLTAAQQAARWVDGFIRKLGLLKYDLEDPKLDPQAIMFRTKMQTDALSHALGTVLEREQPSRAPLRWPVRARWTWRPSSRIRFRWNGPARRSSLSPHPKIMC